MKPASPEGSSDGAASPRTQRCDLASTSRTPKWLPSSWAVPRRRRSVRARLDVRLKHLGIIHLVDVVAGQDENVVGLLPLDGVDVLVDGVGRALYQWRRSAAAPAGRRRTRPARGGRCSSPASDDGPRDIDLYWVRMWILPMPELMQLDRVKSMIR